MSSMQLQAFQSAGSMATSALGGPSMQKAFNGLANAAMSTALSAVMMAVSELLKRSAGAGQGMGQGMAPMGGGMGGMAPQMGPQMGPPMGMPMGMPGGMGMPMGAPMGMPMMGPPMGMPMAPMGAPMGMPGGGMPGMGLPGAMPGMPGAMPAMPMPLAQPLAMPGLQMPQMPQVQMPAQFNPAAGLQGIQGQTQAPSGPQMPSANDKAPPGKSAEQIVNDNPTLKHLGHQKDIKRDELKKQCGDWENEPDPQKRADAAQRVSNVINHIKGLKGSDGSDRGKIHTNGKMEGITKSGDARHGTEAGVLKDFAEKGYGSLPKENLPTTKDSHVKPNGTNMDNFQWGCKQAAKALFFIPGLSNVLNGIGNSEGGFLGALKGGLGGVVETWKNNAEGLMNAIKKGRINPMQALGEMYKANIQNSQTAPEAVKDVTKFIP